MPGPILNEYSSKKDYYERLVREAGCTRYQPCEICYKCKIKASHLFVKCSRCGVPICGHDERARNYMIRRENFRDKLMHFLPDVTERFAKYEATKEGKRID